MAPSCPEWEEPLRVLTFTLGSATGRASREQGRGTWAQEVGGEERAGDDSPIRSLVAPWSFWIA